MTNPTSCKRILGAVALALTVLTAGCGGVGLHFRISTVADAGPAQDAQVGATVTLNGSGSSSGWNLIVSWQWSFISRPVGSTATLRPTLLASATFVPDVAGPYQVMLRVTDQAGNSSTTTVAINALPPA